jgi:Recombinase
MTVLDSGPPPEAKQVPVGLLLANAFAQARSRYAELNSSWIRISFLVGSRLPASLMFVSIQREGEVDLVIRCIEDELAQMRATQQDDPLFVVNYLNLMSTYWIGGMYETFRLLRERKLAGDDQRFSAIFTDLELLRIPLEKHEITKNRTLAEKERSMISMRTKAALAAAKARGVKLGGPKLAEARQSAAVSIKALADHHAANVLPLIREIQRAGATSLHQIADALNARGISTPRGGRWYAKSISNVLARA